MQDLSVILPILIATLVGSLGALLGGVLLLLGNKSLMKITHILVPFAAGALLSTAFFELIPETAHHAEELESSPNIFLWVLLGIIGFYLLDRGIHWYRFHRSKKDGQHGSAVVPLVVIGDSLHNFIDGIVIAITFLVEPALGVVTTVAIIAHELPQEIGDFAVLLHEGMSKRKVLLINLFSALLAVLGAMLVVIFGSQVEQYLAYALSITAGFFIYIALANLLPNIHSEDKKGYAIYETISLILGVIIVIFAITLFEHRGH